MGELIMKTNRIITMLAVAAAAMACNQAEIESPSALKANQFMEKQLHLMILLSQKAIGQILQMVILTVRNPM